MASERKKPGILHISYDLRRIKKEDVTSAVKDLIIQSKSFSTPYVISLQRVISPQSQGFIKKNYETLEVNAFGFPFGILLRYHLKCANKIIHKAKNEFDIYNFPINIIHAHKLTFEGKIGYEIAKKKNLPLIFTIRQTDFAVFKYKPFFRSNYRQVIEYSSAIIFLVPYMVNKFKGFFDDEFFEREIRPKLVFLPNMIHKKISPTNYNFANKNLLTVVRMTGESVRRKNLNKLLMALRNIQDDSLKLKIIGDGPYLKKVEKWIRQFELESRVQLLGKIENREIDKYYRQAHAFVLPSKSESFGMVYAESLMNGTPILYSKNTGFDGLFNGVGEVIDPYDVKSIEKGIVGIIRNNEKYRKQINVLQQKGAFDIFFPHNVREKYENIISNVISGKKNE